VHIVYHQQLRQQQKATLAMKIAVLNDNRSYPVLMAIISMSGLRRIFGKFRAAPPVLCPPTFFVPRKQTVLPAVNINH